jgi:glycosyltransferase 2 family protein
MESVPQSGSGAKTRRRLFLWATNIVSIACLWWVLHDLNWHEFAADVRVIHWRWVIVAVVADVLVYFWHGWRWSLLLTPVERIPLMRSVRAIYVGLFANEVLPLRTGEVIRCYLQARWSSIPFSVTLSSALIERIFDGFWLVLCMLIVVKRVPGLPRFIIDAAVVLGVFVLVGAVIVAFAMFYRQRAHAAFSSESKFHRHVRVLIEDLHRMGHSRFLYFAALATIPYLLTQIVPIYAMMWAFDFADTSWGVASVLMIVLRLGSAIPQAPGNVGTFQYLAVLVLFKVFGYDEKFAKEFSLVLWAVVTVPLLLAGFIALAFTEAHIGELSRTAKSEMPVAR